MDAYILLITFVILLIAEILYFRVADYFNIIDKPNKRSSHFVVTLRGGGIIWWMVSLIAMVTLPMDQIFYFFIGITLISLVSFWDDVRSLPNILRVSVHFLSIGVVFWGIDLFHLLPWYLVVVAFVFFVGAINAYNFMDGINGMNGLYTLAILGALAFIDAYYINFIDSMMLYLPMVASAVFLLFNFRVHAKCFAGDVGSMGAAFWVLVPIIVLMVKTQNLTWILLLSVYGADTISTILHRLYLKQNIFDAHRMHFYQILANERNIDHRVVSFIYAAIQLIVFISLMLLLGDREVIPVGEQLCIILGVTGVLSLHYPFKLKMMRRVKRRGRRDVYEPLDVK